MENFWKKLNKPFFCLAPMSDVTDISFRQMLAKYSKNRENKNEIVFWTEFVSADGLCDKLGRKKLSHILKFKDNERPIVAQVFGANPENMKKACQYIASLDFDGIDINMGCPDKSVIAQGAGSALIKNPNLAREIIKAAKEGIKVAGKNIPVSVKTRIGFNPSSPKGIGRTSKEDYLLDENWVKNLLEENISALIIHLRTKKEMSLVKAHWELVPKILALRDNISPETLIIGNGDINSLEEAKEKAKEYKVDGVMIGRGFFGNPFLFNKQKRPERSEWQNIEQKLNVLVEHTKLFEKELGGIKSFDIMKKHYKAYVNGFNGAKELRIKLMGTKNSKEVEKIIKKFLNTI